MRATKHGHEAGKSRYLRFPMFFCQEVLYMDTMDSSIYCKIKRIDTKSPEGNVVSNIMSAFRPPRNAEGRQIQCRHLSFLEMFAELLPAPTELGKWTTYMEEAN